MLIDLNSQCQRAVELCLSVFPVTPPKIYGRVRNTAKATAVLLPALQMGLLHLDALQRNVVAYFVIANGISMHEPKLIPCILLTGGCLQWLSGSWWEPFCCSRFYSGIYTSGDSRLYGNLPQLGAKSTRAPSHTFTTLVGRTIGGW